MRFALISEGTTDRPIIEVTLLAYFKQHFLNDGPLINSLQPKDKEPGGWTRVLEYCKTEEFKGSFQLNDYVIIQIDSDKHTDEGFDVPVQNNISELIEAIKQRIIQSIGQEFYGTVQNRIIFAISVQQIECWLLPFYATTNAHKSKEVNCCKTLNKYLIKKGFTIDCDKAEGSYDFFLEAAKLIVDKKIFFKNYSFSESLKYYVDIELAKVLQEEDPNE